MTSWTRLVRFEDESGKVRLGQPVDASQDVGLACAAGEPVQVKLIEGDLFDGKVTENTAVVKKVSCSVSSHALGKYGQLVLFRSPCSSHLSSCSHPLLESNAASSAVSDSTTGVC